VADIAATSVFPFGNIVANRLGYGAMLLAEPGAFGPAQGSHTASMQEQLRVICRTPNAWRKRGRIVNARHWRYQQPCPYRLRGRLSRMTRSHKVVCDQPASDTDRHVPRDQAARDLP
jgi:hypothetical protein